MTNRKGRKVINRKERREKLILLIKIKILMLTHTVRNGRTLSRAD